MEGAGTVGLLHGLATMAAATLATRGRRCWWSRRRPEGGNAGGAGGAVGHPARNRGEAVEGGGAPGEVRAAALWGG